MGAPCHRPGRVCDLLRGVRHCVRGGWGRTKVPRLLGVLRVHRKLEPLDVLRETIAIVRAAGSVAEECGILPYCDISPRWSGRQGSNVTESSEAPPSGPVSGAQILVVDDSPRNLQAIEVALGEYADRLVSAASGEDALRLMLQQDFALILLDVQLPSMDGFQVARLVRERQRSRATPIIFITAYSQSDTDVLRGYALGAVDFLFKPIVAEVLRAKVSVLLDLQERTAEVRRQAARLREHERREHEAALESERKRWQEEALRHQMENERRRADELAQMVRDLERAEAELSRSNQALAEADRRKDEFLAYLAHELRNPLAPLAAGLEIVREALSSEEGDASRARLAMERQLTHMTRLVDDLLDVSRINSGRIQIERAPVSVSDVVEQAVEINRPGIGARHQELVVQQPEEAVAVLGDRVRLTQVISNLLNNASRYTPEGGKIQIEVATDAEGVTLTVRDTGRGMNPELVPRVFDMFFRTENGGLGVGLALVDRLVHLHGGNVSAKSAGEGRGSEFQVWLPRHSGAFDRPRQTPPDNELWLHGTRVVLVEDSPDIVELVSIALKRRGMTVASASDGPSGVELIVSTRPDVAVVDVGLPKLDGCQVAQQVRSEMGERRPFLIAMTGYGREADRHRALAAGFDLHLVKPVRPRTLVRAIAERSVAGLRGSEDT